MRIPLLIGARPPYVKWGALVPLVEGEWEVSCVGLKDTVAYLWSNKPPTRTLLNGPFIIEGGRNVRVWIEKPGKEEYFSVFAKKVSNVH